MRILVGLIITTIISLILILLIIRISWPNLTKLYLEAAPAQPQTGCPCLASSTLVQDGFQLGSPSPRQYGGVVSLNVSLWGQGDVRIFWQIKAVSWWHPVTSCLAIWQTFLWTSLVLQCVCWLTLVTNPTSVHGCPYQSPAPYLCEATGSEHGLQVEKKGAVHWRAHMHIVMHKATCVDIRRYIQQVHCHRYECI